MLFFLGNTQLKVICLLSAVGLFITVGITCYSVSERVLIKRGYVRPAPRINLGIYEQSANGKGATGEAFFIVFCVDCDLAYDHAFTGAH